MKNPHLLPLAAIVLLVATGCDKHSPDVAKKIAELEQKNHESADRQRELEQQLEDQKLATERDAIERERVKIEDDRAELARQQGAAAAEQDQAILEREKALSNREGKLEQFQAALAAREDDLHEQTQQLSERDRDLAGREALAFEQPAPSEPVADYGMFYDSLSSYGSWFETQDYGYVWQPVAVRDSNWRPYSRGRWACSDRGWTWISEEPFGWATYHYGRWSLLRGRGWVWVPGAEWAPCWVSWRENGSHIGWAPLPPETMAYRGHNWDSSVDTQFGIGAFCYNFVEMQYFGSSLYDHCLPVSANAGCFQQTSNITYIHIVNRQVICGGPKYKDVCKGVGRPLPFYRLEIDQHPRPSRDSLGMRPRIKGDHLVVSAPNMDVAWNDGLKPKRIKDRIEKVTVERDGNLGREITDRYRQTREQERQKAEAAVVELGGADQFDQRREEKLQGNRRQADGKGRKEVSRDVAKNPERPQREIPNRREPERIERPAIPDPVPDRVVQQPNETRPRTKAVDDRRIYKAQETPRVAPTEAQPRPQRQVADSRVIQTDESPEPQENRREQQRQADSGQDTQQEANERRQEQQAREMQRQTKQNEAQQEASNRKQDEQAQQRQAEKQREAAQAREAQKEAAQQQRQQQENAQQREQQRAQRQQQEDQQRDTQRQQERAQQRQQEENQRQQDNARQRQQEENQRQQDNARQRQQEENNQRQRQQEDSQRQRQQDDSRQKQEKEQKDNDDSRKRGR